LLVSNHERKGDDRRDEGRQQNSLSMLMELQAWLENPASSGAKIILVKAITYPANNINKLMRYTEARSSPIDNNAVQRAIRPFVIGQECYSTTHSTTAQRALNFTVWPRQLKHAAKSPMRATPRA
jgi:hypothetical protein